ncbi:RING finger protein [Endozoicomonas sp. 4G]|uniref:RING finger protein n=1 Tax=Endozoicomonas sp. 4G TaxID=2872754 RepID=UPI002078A42C|nr:RING finger protein [Endozoicomonas sp. 4G]
MLLSFLGPHFLSGSDFSNYFTVMRNSYTVTSFNRAFFLGSFSENISEYRSSQNMASQFIAAGLDTEIAFLIGLTAMASAAFDSIRLGMEWPTTLETLLHIYLPYEIMATIYWNLVGFFPAGHLSPVPQVFFTAGGMQEFTQAILDIDLTPEPVTFPSEPEENLDRSNLGINRRPPVELEFPSEPTSNVNRTQDQWGYHASGEDPNSERQDPVIFIQHFSSGPVQDRNETLSQSGYYFVGRGNRRELEYQVAPQASGQERNSGHRDPATVIQQQNELIARLRQELANRNVTEEAGAVGGNAKAPSECVICTEPLEEVIALLPCGHAGLCRNCVELFVEDEKDCPVCRVKVTSSKKIFLSSPR